MADAVAGEAPRRIVVGRFGRPHGIRGGIVVHSFTDPLERLADYVPWEICRGGVWQSVPLKQVDLRGRFLIANVEGYATPEAVSALTNLDIAVEANQLPRLPEGEYYWFELTGMEVVSAEGVVLGRVVELMPTGSNDVLVIQGDKRHLVPWLPEQVIRNVDTIARRIVVDWDPDF